MNTSQHNAMVVTMTRAELSEVVEQAIVSAIEAASERVQRAPEGLIDCKELARRIGRKSTQRLTQWVKENGVPHVFLTPGEMRFNWDKVLAHLEQRGMAEAPGKVVTDGND